MGLIPEIVANQSLQKLHTFGVEVHAQKYVEIQQETELLALLDQLTEPYFILGGGSNVLFTQDFPGLVIKNRLLGKSFAQLNEEEVLVVAKSGENWHDFVLFCLDHGFGGIENLALIPGTVGAAPIQNIGAYGAELEQVFVYLEAIELATGISRRFDKEACAFGYRDSIFKQSLKGKYFITEVCLRLTTQNHTIKTNYGAIQSKLAFLGIQQPSIREVAAAVMQIRQEKLPDPHRLGNAGSFFKNPIVSNNLFQALQQEFPNIPNYPQSDGMIKLAAGWLIDQCGWKGKRQGRVGAYEKQALVLVNYGGASGTEIRQLAQAIKASVWNTFNVQLQEEVNVL